MFLHILKRDLKRKKTMNLIILLFVILTAMFFSSSMNNIISIMGGVDRFLNMAGMKDYVAIVNEPNGETPFAERLDGSDVIKGYRRETAIIGINDMVRYNGKRIEQLGGMGILLPADEMCYTCFDRNNDPVTEIGRGKFMVTNYLAENTGIKTGDTIEVKVGDETLTLEMAGICKDAVCGSEMVEMPSFLLNAEDFQSLYDIEEIRSRHITGIYMVETDDDEAFSEILKNEPSVRLCAQKSLIKKTYILSISVAGIIMAVSVFLIIISFVVLRFTIGFTVSEEFCEIGVMKAIGIRNYSVRLLYLVKYFGIAVVGSVIGFFAGIPFGKVLLDSVSRNMVLGNDHPVLIGILSTAAVICLILLFCWSCTAKIKKLSPIDAVRNGQTGERFHKKNLMHLGRSRLGASGFLSCNQVISNPKQTAILTAVFTLCALLVMVLSSTAKTLQSDKMVYLMAVTESDVYLDYSNDYAEIRDGSITLAESEEQVEQTLRENGMPGTVLAEKFYSTSAEKDGKASAGRFMICNDTHTDQYKYDEGSAPQYANEIALGYPTAEEIGAAIGDTISVTVNGETDEYIVTALFNSMNNLGKCGRFHESVELPETGMGGTMAYQINFSDHPDETVIGERIEKLKSVFDTNKVFDSAGYVNESAKSADAISGTKNLTMIVTMLIILMMSVLLERSFIFKEKSEIALMKAIGFENRSVIGIHILRFVIITAVSVLIAALISRPATKLIMDPLFGMMGAVNGMDYANNPTEVYLLFPAAVFAVVTAAVCLTALSMRHIKASDTSGIE